MIKTSFFAKGLFFLFLFSCSEHKSPAPVDPPKVDLPTSYDGQLIIWTGTSIPWQFSPNSYPEQIAKALNAKVVNTSISGSMIILKPTLMYGMSGTYKELIAAKLPQNYSYENRIMPYIKNASVVVIDHGHNDAGHPTGTFDSRDKATLYGAFNTVIEAILKAKPDCKIILTTPPNKFLYGGGEPFTSRFEKLQADLIAYAKYKNLPIWDMMSRSGITKETVGKMTHDYVHPNQDTTDSLAKDGIKFFQSIKWEIK